MAFSLPALVLSRHVVTIAAASTVYNFTYPAMTNTNKKANSVLINYAGASGVNVAVTVDGTTPTVTSPFRGFQINNERTVFFCGLPPISVIGDAAVVTGGELEVYLCYTPICSI